MLPWTILEEQFPVRNVAVSIIGNGVISLLWQLRCYCNPDHNNFSPLSKTTVVAIFPNVCLWLRKLCSNFAGIDPEKLYRATFICQYGLCCCIVWPSFQFDCFVNIWATCKNFLGKWFTAPPPPLPTPGKKLAQYFYRHFLKQNELTTARCLEIRTECTTNKQQHRYIYTSKKGLTVCELIPEISPTFKNWLILRLH